jgi:TatD DNase family protein
MPLDCIVTETDSPDIPPAWLKEEGGKFNEPALLPRIARQLAEIRGVSDEVFASAVWQNAMQVIPRWSALVTSKSEAKLNPQKAS